MKGTSASSVHDLKMTLFTARKRSFGHGNIFWSVCHSVQRGFSVWCHFLSGYLVPCSFWGSLSLVPCSFQEVSVRGDLCPGRSLSRGADSVADPGFSWGGYANSQNPIILQIFCRKLHENERIWTRRGGGARPWLPPLDPPMVFVQRISVETPPPFQNQKSRQYASYWNPFL